MKNFRVGVDSGTLGWLKLKPLEQLDYVHQIGLDGIQFPAIRKLSPRLDAGELREIKTHAGRLGLSTEASVMSCNPRLASFYFRETISEEEHLRRIGDEIRLAAACGWHELHTCLAEHRQPLEVPWAEHLASTADFLKKLRPVLREHGSRINVEPHGDITTFELVRLAEEVGPDWVGICLDTANVVCHCEEPLAAIRRAAPYTHLTHLKDALLFFGPRGFVRQTVPPGRGVIDWREALTILAAHSPGLLLAIEDHKYLFAYDCFEPAWLSGYPDLTVAELGAVMKLTWECQRRLNAGEYPEPETYDRLPREQDAEERLLFGAAHLRSIVKEIEAG